MISFDEKNFEAVTQELFLLRDSLFSCTEEANRIYSDMRRLGFVSEEVRISLQRICGDIGELYEKLEMLSRAVNTVPMQYRAAKKLAVQVSENSELAVSGEREIKRIFLTQMKKEISQIRFSEK